MAAPRYRERLLPRWWAWLVVLALVDMLAIAYGAALGTGVGMAVAAVGAALACWLLWISAPVLTVDDEFVRAGGARLPVTSIGSARAVDRAEIARLRGPGADARLFVELRPLSTSTGVLIGLDDAMDPHPAWLLSSRHPASLVEALPDRNHESRG